MLLFSNLKDIVNCTYQKYEETGDPEVATTHWPTVSRSILFIRTMSARLSTPLQQINDFDHELVYIKDFPYYYYFPNKNFNIADFYPSLLARFCIPNWYRIFIHHQRLDC